MPFLLAEVLNFQCTTHLIGVGSLSNLLFLGDDFVGIEFKNLNQEEILEIHNSKCLL